MVTHLEELCFWLFLVTAGAHQQDWFRSHYFKIWVGGSVTAVTYMPLTTTLTRSDYLRCEAATFLGGSLGSFLLTVCFLPVLWTFPSFIDNMKRDGVDIGTIVRLTKFHEMNTLRIVFRFIFTVPLVILGVDGMRPHHHINESLLWTDFLVIVSGFGCVISSGITLVIFFPRSIEGEIAARDAKRGRQHTSRNAAATFDSQTSLQPQTGGTYLLTSSPVKNNLSLQSDGGDLGDFPPPFSMSHQTWTDENERVVDVLRTEATPAPAYVPSPITLKPNRRHGADVELGGIELSEANVSRHNMRASNVNAMVHNFTSPIDFVLAPAKLMSLHNGSRYTFTHR